MARRAEPPPVCRPPPRSPLTWIALPCKPCTFHAVTMHVLFATPPSCPQTVPINELSFQALSNLDSAQGLRRFSLFFLPVADGHRIPLVFLPALHT